MKKLLLSFIIVLGALEVVQAGGVYCKDGDGTICGINLPPRTCAETCADYYEEMRQRSLQPKNVIDEEALLILDILEFHGQK